MPQSFIMASPIFGRVDGRHPLKIGRGLFVTMLESPVKTLKTSNGVQKHAPRGVWLRGA